MTEQKDRQRSTKTNERLYWNIVKGFAIFLMIYGHCIQHSSLGSFDFFENKIFKLIYSFHMPLFMLTSGYLFFFSFHKRTLKELLLHRTKSMLYPIVFATILNNLLMAIPNSIMSGELRVLDGALFQGIEYSLWFLWSVLSASLAIGFACKVSNNTVTQIILIIVGGLFVALFPNMDDNLFMYPFFVIGFFWARNAPRVENFIRKATIFVFPLFLILLHFYKTEHYIYITPIYSAENGLAYSLKIDIFRFIIGLAGSWCTLAIVAAILHRSIQVNHIPKLVTAISRLGENSLQIYCLSVSLLSGYLPILLRVIMKPYGFNVLAANWSIYNLVFTPLLSILYCAGLYLLVHMLRKLNIHSYIFGR